MKTGLMRAMTLCVAVVSMISCSGDKASKPLTPAQFVGWWRGSEPASLRTNYYGFRSDGSFSWNEYDETRDVVTCIVNSGKWHVKDEQLVLEVRPDTILTLQFRLAGNEPSSPDTLALRPGDSDPESRYVRIAAAPASLANGCDPCYNVHGGGTTGAGGDVRNGTWRIHSITSSSPASLICQEAGDTTVVEPICDLESEFEQGLAELPVPIACNFEVSDQGYELTCCGDTTIVGCDFKVMLIATGAYTETTYTFDASSIVTLSGPAQLCGGAPPCTLTVHETGVWISSAGDSVCSPAASVRLHRQSLPGMRRLSAWMKPH